jgi:hypothetical protein
MFEGMLAIVVVETAFKLVFMAGEFFREPPIVPYHGIHHLFLFLIVQLIGTVIFFLAGEAYRKECQKHQQLIHNFLCIIVEKADRKSSRSALF